jgi:hypothetical protein
MNLTDEEIQGFIDAWERDFGERLPKDRARTEIERLLFFFAMLGRALHPRPRLGPLLDDECDTIAR